MSTSSKALSNVRSAVNDQTRVPAITPKDRVFFSRFRGMKVIDRNGIELGKLSDLAIKPGETLLEVSSIVYKPGIFGEPIIVHMQDVSSINGMIKLSVAREDIPPGKLSEHEMLITETILDKQIVDIDELKVVRVNDVLLARVNSSYCVMGVDVGFKGILRSLGLPWVADGLLNNVRDNIIPWSYIDPLDPGLRRIHLKISRNSIQDLHPADIADILEELDNKQRLLILRSLDEETAAEAMEEMEPKVQATTIRHMESDDVAEILENMNSDDAADILSMMPEDQASEVLNLMSQEEAKDVKELLEYSSRTAGGMMTNEFVSVPSGFRVSDVFRKLRESCHDIDMIYYVYVLNDREQLLGVMSLRDLLLADPDSKVVDIMVADVISIMPDSSIEEASSLLSKYDFLAVPVVNGDGVMVGIVTFDDALDYIIPEDLKKHLPDNYHKCRRKH